MLKPEASSMLSPRDWKLLRRKSAWGRLTSDQVVAFGVGGRLAPPPLDFFSWCLHPRKYEDSSIRRCKRGLGDAHKKRRLCCKLSAPLQNMVYGSPFIPHNSRKSCNLVTYTQPTLWLTLLSDAKSKHHVTSAVVSSNCVLDLDSHKQVWAFRHE